MNPEDLESFCQHIQTNTSQIFPYLWSPSRFLLDQMTGSIKLKYERED